MLPGVVGYKNGQLLDNVLFIGYRWLDDVVRTFIGWMTLDDVFYYNPVGWTMAKLWPIFG